MHLVMFDIDGTLADTFDLDSTLYPIAVNSELGISIHDNWNSYKHVTDSGILNEILEHCAISGDTAEIHNAVKRKFHTLMKNHLSENPGKIREVPGARSLIELLSRRTDMSVAFATGGWRETAILKLQSIGIDVSDINIATASDALERTRIMQIAEKRAVPNVVPAKKTYFGDAAWDQRACQELGYDFVAVGRRVEHHTIFENLLDHSAILECLGQ